MVNQRLCNRGHELTPENRTKRGECKTCRREREGYQGGVHNSEKTQCVFGHPLIGANLGIQFDKQGRERRYCRQCHAERGRAYYWNTYKARKHPNKKPGRPRKY